MEENKDYLQKQKGEFFGQHVGWENHRALVRQWQLMVLFRIKLTLLSRK